MLLLAAVKPPAAPPCAVPTSRKWSA
jgi:hypothetical protein